RPSGSGIWQPLPDGRGSINVSFARPRPPLSGCTRGSRCGAPLADQGAVSEILRIVGLDAFQLANRRRPIAARRQTQGQNVAALAVPFFGVGPLPIFREIVNGHPEVPLLKLAQSGPKRGVVDSPTVQGLNRERRVRLLEHFIAAGAHVTIAFDRGCKIAL